MHKEKETITLQEVWRLFKETDRKFQETDRKFQETDRKFQETDRLISEKFQETDRKFQETDRLISEKFQETDRKFQETDRKLKERFKETDRLIRQTQKAIGELGNRLGQFVQEMVKPAVVRLFRTRGIDVCRVISNMEADYGEEGIQVDLVVINKTEAIVVECKSNVSVDDVNEHIDRVGKFKRYWPEYSGFKIFGAIAGMVVPDDVSRYAYRQGLYVLVQNGDIVEIRNDDKFEPRVW